MYRKSRGIAKVLCTFQPLCVKPFLFCGNFWQLAFLLAENFDRLTFVLDIFGRSTRALEPWCIPPPDTCSPYTDRNGIISHNMYYAIFPRRKCADIPAKQAVVQPMPRWTCRYCRFDNRLYSQILPNTTTKRRSIYNWQAYFIRFACCQGLTLYAYSPKSSQHRIVNRFTNNKHIANTWWQVKMLDNIMQWSHIEALHMKSMHSLNDTLYQILGACNM